MAGKHREGRRGRAWARRRAARRVAEAAAVAAIVAAAGVAVTWDMGLGRRGSTSDSDSAPFEAMLAATDPSRLTSTAAPTTAAETPPAPFSVPQSTAPTTTRQTPKPTVVARPDSTSSPVKPAPIAKPPAPAKPAAGSTPLRTRIVAAARSYAGRGIPYVWGGKTVAGGLDCSGLVWNVLRDAGLNVPYRTSSALKAWATPIPKSQVQPGDLLFVPGHVAIVVAPGRVVDAANPAIGLTEHQLWSTWAGATYGRVPG